MFQNGILIGITGPVGSGKSSLFAAILGEMLKVQNPTTTVHLMNRHGSRLAIVNQEAWLQSGTVRENIVFGANLNLDFYDRVVEACALLPDFQVNVFLKHQVCEWFFYCLKKRLANAKWRFDQIGRAGGHLEWGSENSNLASSGCLSCITVAVSYCIRRILCFKLNDPGCWYIFSRRSIVGSWCSGGKTFVQLLY